MFKYAYLYVTSTGVHIFFIQPDLHYIEMYNVFFRLCHSEIK